MSALLMLPKRDQVACCFDPCFGQWIEFFGEPRITKRFVDMPLLRTVAVSVRPKKLAIRPEVCRCAPGQPVQSYRLENHIERRIVVSPIHELFTDPGQQRQWTA